MSPDSVSPNLLIALLVLMVIFRLLNNLLKAGYFGLGQISIMSLAERSSAEQGALKSYLDDPIKLNIASQLFDKISLLIAAALLLLVTPLSWTLVFSVLGYLILFDLLIPVTVAAYYPEPMVIKLFPILRPVYLLETPLVLLMARIAEHGRVTMEDEDEEEDPEDVKAFLRAGTEEGIIEEDEQDLLRKVLDFNDTVVREVMTPRTDMKCIEMETPMDQIRETFKETKYSRLPVYRDDLDHIEGFLRIKDFMEALDNKQDIKTYIKPMVFVPETKPISDLLQELMSRRTQMGVVLDEFGGTAGLITLEDLIEEIVGEIHDEHEEPTEDEITKQEDGSYLVDGRVLLEDFSETFKVDVESDDIDTIGGFIFNKEGHIPKEGATCRVGELEVEIAKADNRRIYKILVPTPRHQESL